MSVINWALTIFRHSKLVHLFKYNRSVNILAGINILIGWVFWGNLFYIPLYFQNIRGLSPAMAGSLILPMVVAHGATSGLSGILISLCGRYTPVISGGAAFWVMGAIMKLFYSHATPFWLFFVAGIFEGIGVGCHLQPGKHSAFSFQFCLHTVMHATMF
jgi:hypothetical protein